MMSLTTFATAAIFVLTYAGVALGRIPGLRLDRAGIALSGAALMLAVGTAHAGGAYRAIDLDTLTLLLGMMIVVAHLRLSGFFRLVSGWALTYAHSPLVLLATIVVTTGTLSAFLVNDVVCLVMAPLVIEVTRALRRDPIPYLLAVAMASNVGSTATITGNPQKHDHWCDLADSLFHLCRRVGPRRNRWSSDRHSPARCPIVERIPPQGAAHKPNLGRSVEPAADDQGRVGRARCHRAVLCRRAGREGRHPWWCAAANHPRHQRPQRSIAKSMAHCCSCSPACSSLSQGRKRTCLLPR